jgi:hypothetical protein
MGREHPKCAKTLIALSPNPFSLHMGEGELELCLPSPKHGRGAGGEGKDLSKIGMLPMGKYIPSVLRDFQELTIQNSKINYPNKRRRKAACRRLPLQTQTSQRVAGVSTAVAHGGNPLGVSLSLWEKTALPPRCSDWRDTEK